MGQSHRPSVQRVFFRLHIWPEKAILTRTFGMSHSVIVALCDYVYLAGNVQSSLPLHPLFRYPWIGRLWLRLVYGAVKLFFHLCCQVHIEGSEHIPTQGGVVLVSNHISAFDTLLLPYTVLATKGLQIIWAPAKAELFRSRLLGSLLTSLGVFPVRRGQHDRQAMRRMIAHMRTEKMMLFPEGTRSRDGRLHEGKRTVGKLIYAARPVVVPVAIVGTERIISHLTSLIRGRARVSVYYGKPVALQHYFAMPDTKETAVAIVQEVMSAIAALLYNASRPVATGAVMSMQTRSQGVGNGSSIGSC